MVAPLSLLMERFGFAHHQHDAASPLHVGAPLDRASRIGIEAWPGPGEIVFEIGVSLALHLAGASAVILALAAFAIS